MPEYLYIDQGGQQRGPVGVEELRRLYRQGGVHRETPVWGNGLASWTPAHTLPGLLSPLPAAAPPPRREERPQPPPAGRRERPARAAAASGVPQGVIIGAACGGFALVLLLAVACWWWLAAPPSAGPQPHQPGYPSQPPVMLNESQLEQGGYKTVPPPKFGQP